MFTARCAYAKTALLTRICLYQDTMQTLYTQVRARTLPSRLEDCQPQAGNMIVGNAAFNMRTATVVGKRMHVCAAQSLVCVVGQSWFHQCGDASNLGAMAHMRKRC